MDLMDPRVLHKEQRHPSAAIYFKVAIVLFVLTALEVWAFEVARGDVGAGPVTQLVTRFVVPILLVLSAGKFVLVGMFYMHLKQDAKIYSGIFIFPIIIAVALTFALLLLFAVTHLMP
jgi:cytochrome c oxidase subunit 4